MTIYQNCVCIVLILLTIACQQDSPQAEKEQPISQDSTELKTDTQVVSQTEPTSDTTVQDTPVGRAQKPSLSPPKIEFEHTEYNYDTIQQGDVIEHTFKFKNIGQKPLEIKKVEASCGCTVPAYPFLLIAEGEENTIKARFDSKGKEGMQESTLTVYTNEPKAHTLILEGFVKK